jgi:hypothetical protein
LPYEFEGDPNVKTKRFIVALNFVEQKTILCFKPTTQVAYYDSEPDRLKGVVEYRKDETCFEADRTIVEPKRYPIPYWQIERFDALGQLEILGYMPDDFRDRMKAAVKAKGEWRKSQKDEFFKWFR